MIPLHYSAIAFDVQQHLQFVPERYRPYVVPVLLLLIALVILQRAWQWLSRFVRRHRTPNIHPNLQKYNIDHAELSRQRRKQAARIVATSTGSRLAGFRIVRQVEAVFVEGFKSPEDALVALKAEAAERGANALVNVRTERTAAGRCTASGDGVVVAAPLKPPTRPPEPPAENA